MRFLMLLLLTLAFAYKLRERLRRDDRVPHGYPEAGPDVRIELGEEVVTVAKLPSGEAAIAQGLLRSAGIPSAVQPGSPNPRFPEKPVQLLVRASDADDARALLRTD